MTDEQLIEEAENAIQEAWNERAKGDRAYGLADTAARVALAVFEAHTKELATSPEHVKKTGKAPEEFVTLDFRYGIADALWNAGYRKIAKTQEPIEGAG